MSNITAQREAVDYESITVDNTVGGVGFTATKIDPVNPIKLERIVAFVTVETSQIRYQYHTGAAPTSTEGHVANAGDTFTIYGVQNLRNFRAIRTGGTSATLKVTYSA